MKSQPLWPSLHRIPGVKLQIWQTRGRGRRKPCWRSLPKRKPSRCPTFGWALGPCCSPPQVAQLQPQPQKIPVTLAIAIAIAPQRVRSKEGRGKWQDKQITSPWAQCTPAGGCQNPNGLHNDGRLHQVGYINILANEVFGKRIQRPTVAFTVW